MPLMHLVALVVWFMLWFVGPFEKVQITPPPQVWSLPPTSAEVVVVDLDQVVDEALELLQRKEDGIGEALDVVHARQQCRARVRDGSSCTRPALPPQVIKGEFCYF